MSKLIVLNYSFDASEQKVTFTDYNPIVIERVLLITNIVDNEIIYNFADATKGGTAATNVLTLTYNTTSMSDTDELQIIYDDANTDQTVTANLSATDNAVLDTIDSVLDTINAKLVTGTDIGDVTINNAAGASAVNIQDGGNTITVDGTVTANLGATDNAVLDDIAAKLGTIDTDTGVIAGDTTSIDGKITACNTGAVVVSSGTITAELSATDNAVLDDIASKLGTIDNMISGSEAQVDVVASLPAGDNNIGNVDIASALPAGTNAIGKLAANSGVDIGDVDVTSLPGVAAEGAALGSGMLIQGDDGTDRTNVLVDTDGHLQVDIISGAGSGGTASADDADFTAGTTSGTPAMGVYESSPTSVTDGDMGIVGITAERALKVSIVADGLPALDSATDSVEAVLSATDNAVLDSIQTAVELIDNAISGAGFNITQLGGAAVPIGAGVEATALRVTLATDSTGVISVDDGGGALTVDGTVTANLSATDNAVLDTIDAVLDAINAKLTTGTVIGDVNLGATDNAVLDDIASKLGTIDTDTGVIAGDTTSIDGKITACNTGAVVISSGTVTANLGATDNAVLDAIQAAVETIDNAISGSEMQVDVVAALPAGTNAIGKLAANSGVDIGDVDVLSMPGVVGTIADDATTPGNPVMIGGKAVETDGTDPTSVSAEDDVAILRTTRDRRLLVSDVSPRLGTFNTTETSAQTHDELVAAPGAGLSIYVTDVIVSNGATAGNILFEEDTGSAQTVKIPKLYLGENGGAVMNFKTPIRCTANKNFGATAATVTTYSILVNYYIAP